MQRVGELEYQRTIGFSREDTVGETSLIIDNKKIVDGAKDVVEAKLNRRQITRTVVLDKRRGQQVSGEGDIGTQTEQMGIERAFDQVDIIEFVTGAEVEVLVGPKLSSQVE